MAKSEPKKLKITLVKSAIARPGKHKVVLIGLGLRKLNRSVVRQDTPEIRGMINKVSHLIQVEEFKN
jgi:large subunit ribosomal protein L30